VSNLHGWLIWFLHGSISMPIAGWLLVIENVILVSVWIAKRKAN
jgi:hypothetical protein